MSVLNGLTVIKTFVNDLIADAFAPVNNGLGEPDTVATLFVGNIVLPIVADGGALVVSPILLTAAGAPLYFEVTPYSVWNLDYSAGTNAENAAATYLFTSLRLQTDGGVTVAENMQQCGAVLPDGHNISFFFQNSYVFTNNTANSVLLTLTLPHTGNSAALSVYGAGGGAARIVGTKLYNIPN
jgi:hypothetical protein